MKVAIVVLIITTAVAMPGPNNPSETTSKAIAEEAPTGNVAETATTGNNAEQGPSGTSAPVQATAEEAEPAKEVTIDGATTSETNGPAEALNSDPVEFSSGGTTVEGEAEGSSIFHHKGNNATEPDDGKPQGRHILSFLGSGQRNRFG